MSDIEETYTNEKQDDEPLEGEVGIEKKNTSKREGKEKKPRTKAQQDAFLKTQEKLKEKRDMLKKEKEEQAMINLLKNNYLIRKRGKTVTKKINIPEPEPEPDSESESEEEIIVLPKKKTQRKVKETKIYKSDSDSEPEEIEEPEVKRKPSKPQRRIAVNEERQRTPRENEYEEVKRRSKEIDETIQKTKARVQPIVQPKRSLEPECKYSFY